MRTLNRKLLLAVFVGLGAVSVSVRLVHDWQMGRIARRLQARADRTEAAGDLASARDVLARLLAVGPGGVDARARYASLVERTAEGPADLEVARRSYESAVLAAPGRSDLRRRLADLAVRLGRHAEGRRHLRVLRLHDPADAGLAELLGLCDEGEGDAASAARWYEAAQAEAPARVELAARLARLKRSRLNDPAGGDRAFEPLLRAAPDSWQAWLERSRYRREADLPGAGSDLDRARSLAPDGVEVLLEVARAALVRGSPGLEEARSALNRAARSAPNDPRVGLELAGLEVRAGRPDEAVARLRAAVAAAPADPSPRWSLACLLAERADAAGVSEQADRLAATRGVPAAALAYLRGRVHILRGEWEVAARTLERARDGAGSWAELRGRCDASLARCYGALNRPGLQAEAYHRAASENGTPADRLNLAASLAAVGRDDLARAEYRRALAETAESRAPLLRSLLAANASRPPGRRSWDEIDRLLAAPDVNPDVLATERAEALALRGRFDEARSLLDGAVRRHPDRADLHAAVAALERQTGRTDDALARLAESSARLGEVPTLLAERFRAWSARRRAADVAALKAAAEGYLSGGLATGSDRATTGRALAAALEDVNEPQSAGRVWERVARERPGDVAALLALFELAARSDDEPGQTRQAAALRQAEGDGGTFWRYAEARLAAGRGAKGDRDAADLARRRLAELDRLRPDWAAPVLLKATLDDRAGRVADAAEGYARAVTLGAHGEAVVRRAAESLMAAGRVADADRLLRDECAAGTPTPGLLRLAAEAALRAGDGDRALRLARGALASVPESAEGRVWLGRVLATLGRFEEAVAEFRRATGLAPGHADAWVGEVEVLLRAGRRDAARERVGEAARTLPPHDAPRILAACCDLLGDVPRARASYVAALKLAPNGPALRRARASFLARNGPAADAEAALRDLVARAETPPPDRAWARRALAVWLAETAGPSRASEALALLGSASDEATASTSPDHRRARARVLAAVGGRAGRVEAVRCLDGLADTQTGTADRVLSALLCDSLGETDRALSLARAASKSSELASSDAARLAEVFIRHGQWDDAGPLVRRCEREQNDTLAAVSLRARLVNGQGQAAEAVRRLTGWARARDVGSCVAAARVLEGLGAWPAAEGLLREAEGRSGAGAATLEMAGLLSRRGRVAEALAVCERAWAACRPEAVAAVVVGVLDRANPPADGPTLEAAASRIERSAGGAGSSGSAPALLVALGGVRELQGRDADAERSYRAALEIDPNHAVALNNLATLLSLRGGQGPEALRLAERAVAWAGPRPALLDTRGLARLDAGDAAGAVADLTESLAEEPSAPVAFHLAQAYLRAGRPGDALTALRRSRALAETDPSGRRQVEREAARRPDVVGALDRLAPTRPAAVLGQGS